MDEHNPSFDQAEAISDLPLRRSEERDSLFLSATLRRIDEDAPVTVRVRNLSPGGMMAELGTPFEPGDRLAIALRGVGEIGGAVRWREAGRIGIAFDAPIDPQRARKTVGQRPPAVPASRGPARPKRPKLFG
ncbi:MAG: PilZ domain-containing protein [Sphingomonas sp.]